MNDRPIEEEKGRSQRVSVEKKLVSSLLFPFSFSFFSSPGGVAGLNSVPMHVCCHPKEEGEPAD